MADSRNGDGTDDASSVARRAYRLLLRAGGWLRRFHRGHAGADHLSDRDE